MLGKIGGDAVLTERGRTYASALARHFNQENRHPDLQVWTSRKIRTIQTGSLLEAPTKQVSEIDELDAVSSTQFINSIKTSKKLI